MEKTEKKRKKKRKQCVVFEEEEKESQVFVELIRVLEDMEKEDELVDLQICPKCKSAKVRRTGTMSGDLWGHMGMLPPMFECEECGSRSRLVLKATNRPSSIRDIAIIAEAYDKKNSEDKAEKS